MSWPKCGAARPQNDLPAVIGLLASSQGFGAGVASTKTPGFMTSSGRLASGPTTEPRTGSLVVIAASTRSRASFRDFAQAIMWRLSVADLTVP